MLITEQCRTLYSDTFGDGDGDYEKLLFRFFPDDFRYKTQNGIVVSMLFALPCSLSLNGKVFPARYLFAAATDKRYRGRGYMTALLNEVKKEFFDEVLFLKPAEPGLIEFYKKSGFQEFTASADNDADRFTEIPDAFLKLASLCKPEMSDYTAMYFYQNALPIERLCFPYTME